MKVLVPNLGSTSLKYQLIEFPSQDAISHGRFERIGQPGGDAADPDAAIEQTLSVVGDVDAVGFKAVHGGPRYRGAYRVDDDLLGAMREFLPAAALHNRIYLGAMETFRRLRPELPLVAVFETGFHCTMPEAAATYGVPRAWAGEHGVRKYGFHGASHRYISERTPEFLHRAANDLRLISCHLGGSSSVCAVRHGRSVDTTMGFSPQSGVENATRPGDLDPFAVLYMMEQLDLSVEQMREELVAHGGLAGISGIAGGDVRDIQEASERGDHDAALALETFAYGVKKTIGAFAAAMGGLDAVTFAGGIGERSAPLRALCCENLDFLGVRLDPVQNVFGDGDRTISAVGWPVSVVVLATNEELVVARETVKLLETPVA